MLRQVQLRFIYSVYVHDAHRHISLRLLFYYEIVLTAVLGFHYYNVLMSVYILSKVYEYDTTYLNIISNVKVYAHEMKHFA